MQTNINAIPKQDYLVLCSTITYQHAAYIEDTMNGFAMQQTSFPFACYIIDDASTDGEPEVIKAYLAKNFQMDKAEHYDLELAEVIVAKHNTNPNCIFAVYLLKRNLWKEPDLKRPLGQPWCNRAKYIALCEGDDYWTDPYKLQKQVDYMEEHSNCCIYAHNSYTLDTATQQMGLFNRKFVHKHEYTLKEFLTRGWFSPTQSLMYRQENYESVCPICKAMHGDYSLQMNLLMKEGSYLYYDNQLMSVYRQGGWASTNYNNEALSKDFITILTYYKEHSNHRCDDVFDELLQREQSDAQQYNNYQNEFKKSKCLYIRIIHLLCRGMVALGNKYVNCLSVNKAVKYPDIPTIEEFK